MNSILNKLFNCFGVKRRSRIFDFNLNNPLGGGGERVDIFISDKLNISEMDIYQLSHLRRYEFASDCLPVNTFCADLACGTGYGSILLSKKNRNVLGVDINSKVIQVIRDRYILNHNVIFECCNLLTISFTNKFDCIVSFETIEHFCEGDIVILLKLFFNALKRNGKLLISVPYMQEECENAKKLGFHLTYNIDEAKINAWASEAGFTTKNYWYQNYVTHDVCRILEKKDFIVCEMIKNGS